MKGLLPEGARLATLAEVELVAGLLDAFNREYDTPTPGTSVLAARLVRRQRGGELLEINVDGDDADARRFYERHGYTNTEPGQEQPQLYY